MRSFKPNIWGQSFWMVLESFFFTIESDSEFNEMRENIALLLYLYTKILPCEECRVDYCQFVEEHSIEKAVETLSNYRDFVYSLRARIQQKNGAPFRQDKSAYLQYLKNKWNTSDDAPKSNEPRQNIIRPPAALSGPPQGVRRPCGCGGKRR